MRKSLTLAALLLTIANAASAADGDTISVRAHDSRDIGWWGAYDDWGVFPPAGTAYRKVLLHFTMGCASTGCSDWDYTVQIDLRHRTGQLDSTLQLAPSFLVNGQQQASLSYTAQPTFTTSWNGTSVDTLWADTLHVQLFQDPLQPFIPTAELQVFPASLTYDVFDEEGNVTGTGTFEAEATLVLTQTEVYTVFEVIRNLELARAITPYGGYMANGQQGFNNNWRHTFTYDVTAYQHLLRDSVEFRAFYGGWSSGFSVTLDFELIEGIPPMEVLRISQAYDSGPGGFPYPNAQAFENNSAPPRQIALLPATQGALARTFITGHGQAGEFTPGISYFLRVNGTMAGIRQVWKGDCGMNAIYPQGGTWVYNRANWCPGEAVPIFDHDISGFIQPGQTNTIDADLTAFNPSAEASYIMETQVIEHSGPTFALDAEVVAITAPSGRDMDKRFNPMCGSPRIILRNSGAQALTSLTVTYGLEGGTAQTHQWTGNLKFLETEEVVLPVLSDWSASRVFYATVSMPNGGQDQYAPNDTYRSPFHAPDAILGSEAIILQVKSNNFGSHNAYWLYDDNGNVLFSRTSMANNTTYNDTLFLAHGCYRFHLIDTEGNGLSWWAASNQGNGFARIRKLGTASIVKNFNPDFGSEISYWFTFGSGLGMEEEQAAEWGISAYPNPVASDGQLHIMLPGQGGDARLWLLDALGREMVSALHHAADGAEAVLPLNGIGPGIYVLMTETAKGRSASRVMVR